MTVAEGNDSATVSAHEAASRLLFQVMGDARFANTRYLDWLYAMDHPVGRPVWVHGVRPDGELDVHVAAVQQRLRRGDRVERLVLIVNVAVRPDSRGQNSYVSMVLENAERVIAEGVIAGFGVTNARSTTPSINALGGRLVGPLPVRIVPPTRLGRGGVESIAVDESFLASERFTSLAAELDGSPSTEWVQSWDADVLRWRLSRPDVEYVMHIGPDAIAVSMVQHAYGVPLAVILKMLPRGNPGRRLRGDHLVTAACRFHRAPVALYAGMNKDIGIKGWPLPRDLLPAPLNLVCLTLSELDQDRFRFETFEFLDFDAF